ncbi:MAG: glycosyltransferase family 87 protein [Solirubrobacteraceae bacterium]
MTATLAANPGKLERFRVPAEHMVLGALPLASTVGLLLFVIHAHELALDFGAVYYQAAERLLHGANPYAVSNLDVATGRTFVYPALAAFLFTPFALVGRVPGESLVTLACMVSGLGALRVMGVRDWRVYGIAMLWLPTITAWQTGNLTLPLALLTAIVWKYRERPLVAGLVTAIAISLKPFVWPLALWLLATRRWRACGWTVAWGVAINLSSWTIVGFGRISDFVNMSSRDLSALWRQGYSVVAALHHLGAGRPAGEAVLMVATALVMAMLMRVGWRGDERRALVLAVALMLVASPLVWTHYFALLMVALASSRTRFDGYWVAPVAMWVCPPTHGVQTWELVVCWLAAGVCIFGAWRDGASDRLSDVVGDRLPDVRAVRQPVG